METIGFVGLGHAGMPLARRLVRAGYELVAHDLRQEPVEELRRLGARVADSPAELARESSVMLCSLPSPQASEQVVLGPNGLLEGAAAGSVAIETSTISPELARRMHTAAAERGVAMLDIGLSGGVSGAEKGTMTMMVGGDAQVLERVRPILAHLGSYILHVGPGGMGMVVKVVNNSLSHANMAALAEAIAMGVKAGADPRILYDAIAHSSGMSHQLHDRYGRRILKGDFEPGMKVDLAFKDSQLALDLGRATGTPLFVVSAAHAVYEWARAAGLGSLDYSSIIQLWEKLLNVEARERE